MADWSLWFIVSLTIDCFCCLSCPRCVPCDWPRLRLRPTRHEDPAPVPRILRALWLVNAENAAIWLVSEDHDQCGRPCDQILRAQRLQASRNILLKAVSLIREKLLVESDSQNLDTDVTILHVLPAHRQILRESSYQSQRDMYCTNFFNFGGKLKYQRVSVLYHMRMSWKGRFLHEAFQTHKKVKCSKKLINLVRFASWLITFKYFLLYVF